MAASLQLGSTVSTWRETREAVIQGEPGAKLERRCAVCDGRLVAGDHVIVILTRIEGRDPVIHAVSHDPDCVAALEREAREGA